MLIILLIINYCFTLKWDWIFQNSNTQLSDNLGEYNTPPLYPSARFNYASYVINNNTLILFGGMTSYFTQNDLWKYNLNTDQWSIIRSDGTGSSNPTTFNYPGSRYGLSFLKSSYNSSKLLLFGGFGGPGESYYLNQLWSWNYKIEDTNMFYISPGSNPTIDGFNELMTNIQPGGVRSYCHTFIPERNANYIFGGWGVDQNGFIGSLNRWWKLIETNDTDVFWGWERGSGDRNIPDHLLIQVQEYIQHVGIMQVICIYMVELMMY